MRVKYLVFGHGLLVKSFLARPTGVAVDAGHGMGDTVNEPLDISIDTAKTTTGRV